MGEAKRRQEAHKHRSVGQGLLLPDPLVRGSDGSIATRKYDLNEYNSAILYWDKIACPDNNLISITVPHEAVLLKEGILLRPHSKLYGSFQGVELVEVLRNSRILDVARLEKETPGYWALSGDSLDDLEHTSELPEGRTYLVELCSALPLPPEGTPIDDILNFRLQRKDELKNLQNKLRDMYLAIAESGDRDFAASHQLGEIDKACRDTIKVTKEWWKLVQLSDLKSVLPIGFAIGYAAGMSIAMPTTGALLGAAGGFIKITSGIRKKRIDQRRLPFWYAAEVSRKF